MAFYSQGKEFLNLPEQVQKNIDDISNLTVAVATKQELANAVNDTNLKEKVEAVGSYDLGAVSVTSLTNTGNTTNTGTLDQEGKATFGSDVEVDGSATFNSPESLVFKTGSLDFSELTNFISTYYANAYRYKMAERKIVAGESGSSDFDFNAAFSDFSKATNLLGICYGATLEANVILAPADRAACAIAFSKATGDYSVTINSASINLNIAFRESGVPRVLTDTSCKITDANYAFQGDEALTAVGTFDMSSCGSVAGIFAGCRFLKEIHCTHWKSSFAINSSTQFEESDLVEIIGNLDTVTTAQTLTMGSTNLAKLTQDEILVANGKGWTLA